MSSLTFLEKRQLEDLLGMGSGYVLDFKNRTFQEFFRDIAQVDIYSQRYEKNGTSKANHLRAFWEIEDDKKVGKVISGLLEIWRHQFPDKTDANYDSCLKIVERLLGKQAPKEPTERTFWKKILAAYPSRIYGLSPLSCQFSKNVSWRRLVVPKGRTIFLP